LLGPVVERVLVALKILGPATATEIVDHIQQYLSEPTIDTIYITLTRMSKSNLIVGQRGQPTPVPGGKAKVHYSLTPHGAEVVAELDRQRGLLEDMSAKRPPTPRLLVPRKIPNIS
jgi:DNA-binding PadR family transcriptional regulator